MTWPNRIEWTCKILHDECDNPKGCYGCYHQFQQDVHNYYNGVGPLPREMEHMRRLQRDEDREI